MSKRDTSPKQFCLPCNKEDCSNYEQMLFFYEENVLIFDSGNFLRCLACSHFIKSDLYRKK